MVNVSKAESTCRNRFDRSGGGAQSRKGPKKRPKFHSATKFGIRRFAALMTRVKMIMMMTGWSEKAVVVF
jgi:hypothetical protein